MNLRESVEFVRNWMKPQLKEGVECPCCGRFTKIYRRNINNGMVRFLVDFYKRHGTDQVIIANYSVTDQQHAHHQEYEKLPHWGLLDHDNSTPRKWWITKLGCEFVNNQVHVRKYIWLKHGVCVGQSGELVGIKKAAGAHFNYDELMAADEIRSP